MTASMVDTYRFDNFVVDARSVCLRRDGVPVPLRPKSFDVLLYLVRHRGRLVSKDEMFDNVWSNVVVTDNSLVQCIREVRQALGDDRQSMIETVAKRGYVFTPPVAEGDDDAPSAAFTAPIDLVPSSAQPAPADASFAVRRRRRVFIAGSIAAALMIAGGTWWVSSPHSIPQQPVEVANADRSAESRLSIAVLPFGILGEATDDYFSIGISEDIAAALGRFPGLAVVAPKVTSQFRGAGASAEEFRRQLKVRYLVEGSVRRTPQRIRIAIRLTDLPRGILLWSESYDASPATIFAIQDDVVLRIAGALSVKLATLEQSRAASKSTGSLEAYDLVLQGRELMTRLNRTAHSQARIVFERAIALDSRYAAAYVGLGRIDLSAVALGWTADPEAALNRSVELARKAISLDEFSPAAHVLLGRAYARMKEYERAVNALKRAVALNPSEPDSYAGLGDALLWSGDVGEAIKALETATSIDPRLSAEDLFCLGAAYFLDGRIADAIRVLERITNRGEGNVFIYAMLAATYADSGRDVDARAAAAEVRKLTPFFDVDRFGSLFKKAEHRDRLAKALKRSGL